MAVAIRTGQIHYRLVERYQNVLVNVQLLVDTVQTKFHQPHCQCEPTCCRTLAWIHPDGVLHSFEATDIINACP